MNKFMFQKRWKKLSYIRGQIMPTRNNNRRKSICVSWSLSMKQVAKITFAQSKRRPLQSIVYLWEKKFIGTSINLAKGESRVLLTDPLLHSKLLLVLHKMLSQEIWERLQLIEISTVWQPNLIIISHAKSGRKRVIKEMMTGSLSLPFSLFPAPQLFACLSPSRLSHSFASSPLSESLEQATLSQSAEYGKCMHNFFKMFIVHTRIAELHAATVKLRDMMLFKNLRHYLFTRFLSNTAMKRRASYPSLILSYLHKETSWWPDNKIVEDSREIDSCMTLFKWKTLKVIATDQ